MPKAETVSEDILIKMRADDVLEMSRQGLGREDMAVTLSMEIEDVRMVQRALSRAGLLPEYFGARNG
jgi:hypothetical protein